MKFWILLIYFSAGMVQARTIRLDRVPSEPFGYAENYVQMVESIQVDDVVGFSNGRRERVVAILGANTKTKVLRLTNGHALRIPRFRQNLTHANSLDSFWFGMRHLQSLAPQIPSLALYDYLPHEYAEVERLEVFYTLNQFIRDWYATDANDSLRYLGTEDVALAERALFKFVAASAHLSEVGDMSVENLVYVPKRGWMFLDVDDYHVLFAEVGWDKNLFLHMQMPPKLSRWIKRIVLNERRKLGPVECAADLTGEDVLEIIERRIYE